MIRTKISAYWAAVTGVVTFLAGTVVTPLISELHHGEELNERERAFVMDIVKLEVEHPNRAVSTAQLSTLVARKYIRNKDFADALSNMLAGQALALAKDESATSGSYGAGYSGYGYGDAYVGASQQYDVLPQVSQSASSASSGTTAALDEVKVAERLASAATAASKTGAQTPAVVTSVLQPTADRLFFQIAEEGQRDDARILRGQLRGVLGNGASINGDELVGSFTGPTQLRYFYPGDQAEANRIASILKLALPSLVCRKIGGYEAAPSVRPRLFEVWLGKGDRPKAALANAPAQPLCR